MMNPYYEEEKLGKPYDARLMRRLLRYLWPYRWRLLSSFALVALSVPFAMAGPPLMRVMVDQFLVDHPPEHPQGFTRFIVEGARSLGFGESPQQGIVFIALIFMAAGVICLLIQYTQAIVLQSMGQFVMYDLRKEIFAHVQRLPISFYDKSPVGRLMTRLTSDVEALSDLFTGASTALVGDVAMIVYILCWMLQVNWRLALVSFAILPPLILLTLWFKLGARTAFREMRKRLGQMSAFMQERFSGMHVTQLMNCEEKELGKFREINGAHCKANVDTTRYYAIFNPTVELIGTVGIALIVWYGGGQVIRNVATLGTLIAFIQLARAFYDPISDISERYNMLQAAMASAERIFGLLDEPVTIKSAGDARALKRPRGRIEFRNVYFAYNDDDWVLQDVSFTIEPGERVGFVGHTGAGKTTISSLLMRFYDIQRGQILLDDTDIRAIRLEDLRSCFGIVHQDVFLFSGDLGQNITLGNQGISEEALRRAAREVHADEFIARLPDAYRTVVRPRGAGLSAGQRQLISFARALAIDPPVLILDEATSSVDAQTEWYIRDAVERIMAGRTALVIAHRLATVQAMDRIIVMHKGRVREIGTHHELLGQRGSYWKLHQLQMPDATICPPACPLNGLEQTVAEAPRP